MHASTRHTGLVSTATRRPAALRSRVDLPPRPERHRPQVATPFRLPLARSEYPCRPAAGKSSSAARVRIARPVVCPRRLPREPAPPRVRHSFIPPGREIPRFSTDPLHPLRPLRGLGLHPLRTRQRDLRSRAAPPPSVRLPRRRRALRDGPGPRVDRRARRAPSLRSEERRVGKECRL